MPQISPLKNPSLSKYASILTVGLILILSGCAKERPVKTILANGRRVPVSAFEGTFFFQKTVTEMKFAGSQNSGTPVGAYEIADKIVRFEAKEKSLDVVALDPLFKSERAALSTTLLASFSAKRVDVLRRQNSDGSDTHEEEETDTRKPWAERAYLVLDPSKDAQDQYSLSSDIATNPENIEIDPASGAININVSYQLKDNTQVKLRYSFIKYSESKTYIPKHYSDELATRFGFFSTTTLSFDKYGRVTESAAKQSTVMNRWDTSKKIVYYLSKDFPAHLKTAAMQVFADWNSAFKDATGRDTIELRENSGQELGDLRYSMVVYDPTVDASHGILGYGPSFSNPRTGEIIKADVMLFGGVLKSSLYRERMWVNLLEGNKNVSEMSTPSVLGILNRSSNNLSPVSLLNGNKLESLVSKLPVKDSKLITEMQTDFHPLKTLAKERKLIVNDLHQNITRMNDDVLATVKKGMEVNKMSDEELETAIFIPLLAHELGHNLGLRHNFMASSDKAHFDEGSQSSSVMDYGFLVTHEPPKPGQYDRAAIKIAYANNDAESEKLLKQNYSFCTDEDLYTSVNGLCHQFDAGTSLADIANSQLQRYLASWIFNNLKNDRVYFETRSSLSDYISRVRRSLIPMRLMYDHAESILNAARKQSVESLWSLTRQRIEADSGSLEENVLTIKVLSGISLQQKDGEFVLKEIQVERRIDTAKIAAVIKDAGKAKAIAYDSLTAIIADSSRMDYSTGDQLHGQLQIRGVIYDKLLALILAGSRTSDPLGGSGIITLFNTSTGNDFRSFLAGILSDTQAMSKSNPMDITIHGISPFDPNLKEIALDLLINELGTAGSVASARRLIEIDRVGADRVLDARKKDGVLRQQVKEQFKLLFKGGLSKEQQEALQSRISILQMQRTAENTIATTPADSSGETLLRASTVLPEIGIETATGRLIRDNLNVLEDMIGAAKELTSELRLEIEAELKKPEPERKPALIFEKMMKIDALTKTIENLSLFMENQRFYLEGYFRIFSFR